MNEHHPHYPPAILLLHKIQRNQHHQVDTKKHLVLFRSGGQYEHISRKVEYVIEKGHIINSTIAQAKLYREINKNEQLDS